MASFLNYFGLRGSSRIATDKSKTTAVRALPASWYLSADMYQLERRAIFSRKWLFITHQSRVKDPGDFLRFEMAGFDFVIARDRNGVLHAFHNVCRHRAYSVVEKPEGNAKILSCRYHGWSYGLDGKLAKAPRYDSLDEFEKENNGLFPIHLHLDAKGFIWVNLDGGIDCNILWEDDFEGVDQQCRFDEQSLDFDDYMLDHTYQLEAKYNWKMAADNFNECYHCPTTHPDVPNFLTVDAHDMEFNGESIQHDHAAKPDAIAKGLCVNSTYYFPNVSMSVSKHFMMIQKFMPRGPTETTVHYEVFRNKYSSDEDFHLIADMYARVMSEDKALCNVAQKNLQAGVYISGELHPRWEKGPLHFQQRIRSVITEHYQQEKKQGREIWPARQIIAGHEEVAREDEELCSGLACRQQRDVLAW